MASRFHSRLRVLLLAAGDLLATFGRRRAPQMPRRILVAHHLLLGDTLMLTPLLAKLRQCYPGAEIVMATPKAIVPLYAGRPYGVEAAAYDPRDPATLRGLLLRRGYDLAVVPGDNRFSWLARALGARWVVAFAGDRPAYKNLPVDALLPYPQHPAAWGDMAAGLVEGAAPARYRQGDWPAPPCRPFGLPPGPYCVLHVGASSALKQWQPEKWWALAQALAALGLHPVWSAGRGEEALVAGLDPAGAYPSMAGKLDLAQLWHLIAGAALLLCPDTGVAHLGRLAGTPTVALFGPGSPAICGAGDFWRDSRYAAVTQEIACRDQHLLFRRRLAWVRRCGRTPRECAAPRCMQAITVDAVMAAARRLLGGNYAQDLLPD